MTSETPYSEYIKALEIIHRWNKTNDSTEIMQLIITNNLNIDEKCWINIIIDKLSPKNANRFVYSNMIYCGLLDYMDDYSNMQYMYDDSVDSDLNNLAVVICYLIKKLNITTHIHNKIYNILIRDQEHIIFLVKDIWKSKYGSKYFKFITDIVLFNQIIIEFNQLFNNLYFLNNNNFINYRTWLIPSVDIIHEKMTKILNL